MKFLDDKALDRLRAANDTPDFTGTRYRLLDRVARGGMGVVYTAEDENLERRVAVKVLDATDTNGELSKRLLQEARVLAQLEHPGIVPVHDVGTLGDGRVFYTMKFVEGQRLDKFLAEVSGLQDRLRLFLRICDAVAFAHTRGVLHRDLKPANVMVGSFGEVLVMDWGLAKVLSNANEAAAETVLQSPAGARDENDATRVSVVTGHGTVMGTPGYMSPEQARGEVSALDARSDIFSLGALLRFVAKDSEMADEQNLPKPLRAIFNKAMSEEPGHRYASVSDLAADVSRYLDGQPVLAYPEGILERAARFYRRYQVAILLIAAYLFMRAVFLLFARPRG